MSYTPFLYTVYKHYRITSPATQSGAVCSPDAAGTKTAVSELTFFA